MKKIFSALLLCWVFLSSCNHDKSLDAKHCWQLIDNAGNNLNYICDKTEAELIACVNNNTCGVFNAGAGLNNCNYYMADGPKSCYLINGVVTEQITESQAALYAKCFFGSTGNYIKTDCDPCVFWYHREKRFRKPSTQFVYTQITKEKFCGDTLATLYQGRQIIRKDDADSLVIIQFSKDATNW
ncbi:MAG: hypothetical protein EOP53_04955 [Sphingobacteriales bacterium]|nr:MAG: hypothetical protein EOP53_04955 [Sphingobacteriales bacterium]